MKLTIDDIADQRAYERERESFRAHIIELKKHRRIGVGPFVSLVFENRDTIRFQIQEMARAERILTDEGIQAELDIYNPLIPDEGSLSATLFIELTSKDELMEWLPKLVGIERAVQLRIDDEVVAATPDAEHERQLTRETITASVHYVHFDLGPEQIQRFADARVRIEVAHENYAYETELSKPAKESLLSDLCG
ncbi:MAG TPA: DUF3501 family protein [Acidimicrobiales bacterium]|nr:DUF3501 family protein [Acidimicrobiales bacterium]